METILVILLSIVLMYLLTMATFVLVSDTMIIHDYIHYWRRVFVEPNLFIYNLILLGMSIIISLCLVSYIP